MTAIKKLRALSVSDKLKWIAASAVMLVLFVLVFSAVPIKAFQTLWDFIGHHETLLTGILAVAAAVATIVQMRVSDRTSLRLSLRPEARRLERLLNPDWRRLQHLRDKVKRNKISRTFTSGTPEGNWEKYHGEIITFRNSFGLALSILNDKEWGNIEDLVSRDTEDRIVNICQIAEFVCYLCREENTRISTREDVWRDPRLTNEDESKRSIFIDRVEEEKREFCAEMDLLLEDLLSLADSVFANVQRTLSNS
ncbi:hypothetical protein K7H91_11855 [Martelella mediterranea]|uniref:hypothetical protein n=1 Tax=Martelella mediterranea TaxID=293089 RepID=UPI001E4BFB9D|nr:hypothetical protein [Martelella mediterranea]MCD1634466.1 hypothetical protein [Martelella mediterranea]